MTGKILAGVILIAALAAGAAMYYLQVYGFYEEVSDEAALTVSMTSLVSAEPEEILADDVTAIDADSSPIRYRACFSTPMNVAMLSETYEAYEGAEPLTAPGWFHCFDAEEIGEALRDGTALAFLGERDVATGVDRVVAVFDDGRGFVWNQISLCGKAFFAGDPLPFGCAVPQPSAGD